MTFLTALDDPDVVARVLDETGGDLRKPSEITRIGETIGKIEHKLRNNDPEDDEKHYIRSLINDFAISDLSVTRDDSTIVGMGFRKDRDPHLIGQIVSGLSYELFASLYEEGLSQGLGAEEAIVQAKDITGKLLMRSTRFVGEHSLSMRDAAVGMLHVDRETFGGAHRDTLGKILEKRGLIDANENIDTLIDAVANKLPSFTLSPSLTNPDEVMTEIENLETMLVARSADTTIAHADKTKPLWHSARYHSFEVIPRDSISLYGDDRSEDGYRTIRLAYDYKVPQSGAMHRESDDDAENYQAFISLVFNADGKLVATHTDQPDFRAF